MEGKCINHPVMKAEWRCAKCNSIFCSHCTNEREVGQQVKVSRTFCPTCNEECSYIGDVVFLPPFWTRLPSLLSYPFKPFPVLFSLIIAALMTGVIITPIPFKEYVAPFLGLFLMLLYAIPAFLVSETGDTQPPKLMIMSSKEFSSILVQQFVAALLFLGIPLAVAHFVSRDGAFLLGLVMFLFYPAVLMVNMIRGDLGMAFSPRELGKLFKGMGPGYFLLVFLFIGVGGIFTVLFLVLPDSLPVIVIEPIHLFLHNCFIVFMYHCMGYAMGQYRFSIGYHSLYVDSPKTTEQVQMETEENSDPDFKRADMLIRSEQYDEAMAMLMKRFKSHAIHESSLSGLLLVVLKKKKMKSDYLQVAQFHLGLLLQEGKRHDARELYEVCQRIEPSFLPTEKVLYKLGELFEERGDFQEALSIYNKLSKSFPESAILPMAFFRAAQIFNDRLAKPEKAKQILQATLKKYPGSDVKPKIEAYLRSI